MYSGMIGQTQYNQYLPEGMPGTLEGMGKYIGMPYMNGASGRQQVLTITPPTTVDASTTYKLTIDGVTINVPTGASTTKAQLGQLIYNAIRAEGQVYRLYDAALNVGTGVVTLTHRFVNVTGVITTNSGDTTNDLTIAQTVAPGTDMRIPFARFVGRKATWTVDRNGDSNAALIDHATDYEILGITLKQIFEKDRIGPGAQSSYPFGATMNVVEDTGTHKGMWVESVENDIDMRTHQCYVAIDAGNEGKVTRTATDNADITTKARYVSNSLVGVNGIRLVMVRWNRFGL